MRERERQRERDRDTDRQTERQRETETDRQTENERERERERDRDRDRETDRQTERERERQTDRQRTACVSIPCKVYFLLVFFLSFRDHLSLPQGRWTESILLSCSRNVHTAVQFSPTVVNKINKKNKKIVKDLIHLYHKFIYQRHFPPEFCCCSNITVF